jgi:predicted kinase
MGTYLVLKKDGKELMDLGRAYNYTNGGFEIETNSVEIDKRVDLLKNELENLITKAVYAAAGKKEALDEMEIKYTDLKGIAEDLLVDIQGFIEYYNDEMIKFGKQYVLSYILDYNKVTYEVE